MINILSGNSMWHLVRQSDWMTLSVLITLLILSIISWTILLYKIALWRVKKNQLKNAITHIKNANTIDDVLYIASKFSNTLPGYFLSKNLSFLKSLLVSEKGTKTELNNREWELLQVVSHDTLDNIIYQQETYLPILAVTAAVSPLLGLFGTVWGLIHSFVDISHKQSADITTVAPGIAEALITTLAGLLVAIPALIMYHYLKLQVRSIEQRMVVLADRFLALVQRVFSNN